MLGAVRAVLRRHPWLIPIAFALALGAAGWLNMRSLETTLRAQVRTHLETVLKADVAALEIWARAQRAVAEDHARDPRVVEALVELAQIARESSDPAAALREADAAERLEAILARTIDEHGYLGFAITTDTGLLLASSLPIPPGGQLGQGLLSARLAEVESTLTKPHRMDPSLELGRNEAILLGARVRSEGKLVGHLGFALPPEAQFTHILTVARPGESGETYAFDEDGVLVSESRFDPQLRALGLLAEGETSALNIEIRDPGGDLTRGFSPDLPVRARPLTRMAASAISREPGSDTSGYRDYRGVPVVGAWTWLPDWQIGVATEMDVAEAYAPLNVLRERFAIVLGLLVAGALGMLGYAVVVQRLRSRVDEVLQLGRYRIEKKVGAGGMGTVYLARHALLRRPTALKVLCRGAADREAVARFEREVQVTSGLTHPNTIEIYDFGYSPDGVFYYAMEYLDGITLGDCVEDAGAQPEARVVYIMKQVCGSLAEAHNQGLIHRDLKPSNVMLCERGGLYDFVKVLDFGLVRSEQQAQDVALTDISSLTGTPLYLPPETVQAPETIDVRADLYQLGAIAYFLLTGQHVFSGDSVYEVVAQHVGATPQPPSAVIGKIVSPELEKLILRCLEKDREQRLANAGQLLAAFENASFAGRWDQTDAREWWTMWRGQHPEVEAKPDLAPSAPSGYTIDLAERLQSE